MFQSRAEAAVSSCTASFVAMGGVSYKSMQSFCFVSVFDIKGIVRMLIS